MFYLYCNIQGSKVPGRKAEDAASQPEIVLPRRAETREIYIAGNLLISLSSEFSRRCPIGAKVDIDRDTSNRGSGTERKPKQYALL